MESTGVTLVPTVTLRLRKSKRRITVNMTDYQFDIARWAAEGWTVVSETHGDADDEVMEYEARQAQVQRQREIEREAPKDHAERAGSVTTRPQAFARRR